MTPTSLLVRKNSPFGCFFYFLLKPVLKPVERYLWDNLTKQLKGNLMKNKLNLLAVSASKINRQHIQTIFVLLSLAMLVLGLGAPDDGGTISR